MFGNGVGGCSSFECQRCVQTAQAVWHYFGNPGQTTEPLDVIHIVLPPAIQMVRRIEQKLVGLLLFDDGEHQGTQVFGNLQPSTGILGLS